MDFNFIPNQPVIFEPLINNKNYLGNYVNKPKVSNTDVQQFAVGYSEAENILEQVVNSSFDTTGFWTTNSSWDILGTGFAEYTGGAGVLSQLDVYSFGTYFLEIEIEGLTSGSVNVLGTTVSENGVTGFFYFSGGVGDVLIENIDGNDGFKINYVSLKKLVFNTQGSLFWEDGTLISSLSPTVSSTYIFESDFNLDPTSGVYGCIKYGINESFNIQLLNEPSFNSVGSWIGTNISGTTSEVLSSYDAVITFDTSNAIHSLKQTGVLEIGQEYTFNLAFNDHVILDNIYVISEALDPTISAPFSDVVSYTFVADSVDFELHFQNNASLGDVSIKWIDMYQTPYDNGNWTFSNVFEYGPANLRTLLLEWTNNQTIFDLPFIYNDFILSLRLCAKVTAPEYNSEREVTDTIEGVRYKRYFKTDKNESLIIEPQTQEIHDAISIIGACSTFKIDGVLYEINQEDYQPDWNESDDNFAGATINVVRVPVSSTAVRCVSGPNKDFDSNFVE